MLTKVNYEVKGQLAKLLATEDLIIENKKVPTASFDVERRVLTLPMWEKASATVYDLLVGHEVGHALFTPNVNWKLKYPDVPMSFVNILEDARIEKLMKRKYAGIVKTFYMGYSELSDQDFFELEKNDVEDMNLPDRINIYHKVGKFIDVPFVYDEEYFRDAASKTDTFDQVLDLAFELHEFMKNQNTESLEMSLNIDNITMGQGGGDLTLEDLIDAKETDQEGEGDSIPSGQGEFDDERPDLGEDTTEYEDPEYNPYGGGEHSDFETITDKTLSDNLENLNDKKAMQSMYDTEYCTIPTLNLKTLHAKNAEVHSYLEQWWNQQQKNYDDEIQQADNYRLPLNLYASVDNEYRLFRRSAQKEVNYLVKEFECKKSADAYARATVSKTGVLDCSKLHSYKYNEDLFKKITTLPDGKNHGLIFVLDWSGSMSNVLLDTIKQLFNLIWFCKKVQIPFQVFAFTNEWNRGEKEFDEVGNYRGYSYPKDHHEKIDGQLYVEGMFSMVEFLTSDCKKGDLETQMMNIWRVTNCLDSRGRWASHMFYQCPHRLGLSGTPLNEALLSLNQLIPQFQKKTGVQKIQCITLTDGEAHPLKFHKEFKNRAGEEPYLGTRSTTHGNVFIRDTNGKTYHCADAYYELTSSLLNQLKGRFPNVNFLGIRVIESRDCNSFVRRYVDFDYDKHKSIMEQWRKTKSLMITDGGGYHAYFGLSSSALNSDSSFEVKEDATKAQIKSAFKKSLSAKKMNKKVLGQFMTYIA